MGPLSGNLEEGIRGTHRIPQTYQREARAADIRRDMGDSQGRSSAGSGGNAVGDDLYRDMAGNRGTVGGITTNIQSVFREEGL